MKKILLAIMLTNFISTTLFAETFKNADDICYDRDDVRYDSVVLGGCVDIGPFKGGFNCKQTIPLRNISGEALTDTTIIWDIDTGFEASMVEACGIDGSPGSCEFDAALDFGPIRMFENSIKYEPMPLFAASGAEAKHSIFFYNLMSGSFSPLTMFRGDDLYAAYTKDGDSYGGRVHACKRNNAPVEHLCYDYKAITYDGAMCVDFGPFKGGMGCKQSIPIRSLTAEDLTGVEIALDLHGMNGNFLSTCGIDDVRGSCHDKTLFNFGPMGMFTRGVHFDPMADYGAFEKHSIFIQSLMNMRVDPIALFTGTNMYTHYTINGEDKSGYIPACPISRETVPDICYDYRNIDYSGVGCVQIGPFKGGIGCKQTIPLRSITSSNLTNVDIFMDTHGMSGSFVGGCGINDNPGLHSTCEVQNRFDFGPMGFFSSGLLYDPMEDFAPFEMHSIYNSAAMSMGGDPVAMFMGENLYTNYVKDGTLISGKIKPCKESYADDLCLKPIDESIEWVWGLPPIIWRNSVPIKNQRNHTVSKVAIAVKNVSFTSGNCRIAGYDRNEYCSDISALDILFTGLGGRGTSYTPPNDFIFNPDQIHEFKQDVGIASGIFFNVSSVYANFVSNGEFFSTRLESCLSVTELAIMPARLDAWDDYRVGLGSDRNISTKVVNKLFTLTVASFNEAEDKYQAQDISTQIYYDLYEEGSITPVAAVSGGGHFDASLITRFENDFTVPDAYKDLRLGFKFCSIHRDGDNILQPDAACTDAAVYECDQDSATAKWHVCKSTDQFAVRPESILISSPDGTDISKLRSGHTYTFDLKAAYWDNSGIARAVPAYDSPEAHVDINKTLVLADNNIDDENDPLLSGDLNLAASAFVDGEGTADINFTDVAQVLIQLVDKDWAAVDNDDTPQSCDDGFKDGVFVPFGAYLCGSVNSTFIPHHFSLKSVTLHNHDNGPITYLGRDEDPGDVNNDITMSAHIQMTIVAENESGGTTQNFRKGDSYYENPLSVAFNLLAPLTVAGVDMVPYQHDMDKVRAFVTPSLLGFGTTGTPGEYTVRWDTTTAAQKLNFNFNKDFNKPLRPFTVNMTDLNVSVTSTYGTEVIKGASTDAPGELSGDATFQYVKVAATRLLFDDISTGIVTTPITVQVYCPLGAALCSTLNVDTTNGLTNDNKWWLSTSHDHRQGDGKIKLAIVSVSGGGSATIINPVVNIETGGISSVTRSRYDDGPLPQTDTIALDPVGTDEHMKEQGNGKHAARHTGKGGWAGPGDVGYVVDGNASSKKNSRLGW